MDQALPFAPLSPLEARVIGALIEKELTTPEYYPLSLNALQAACNQKNNRAPVMAVDERALQTTLYSLQEKRLVECFSGATSRTVKYRERFIAELELDQEERALICELLLRGPQTVGELKGRAARMHPFATLEDTLAALNRLATADPQPLVTELPRQTGHKESRYAHLLGDQPPETDPAEGEPALAAVQPAAGDGAGRLAELEARVAELERQTADLQALFQTFKAQFE